MPAGHQALLKWRDQIPVLPHRQSHFPGKDISNLIPDLRWQEKPREKLWRHWVEMTPPSWDLWYYGNERWARQMFLCVGKKIIVCSFSFFQPYIHLSYFFIKEWFFVKKFLWTLMGVFMSIPQFSLPCKYSKNYFPQYVYAYTFWCHDFPYFNACCG